MSEHQSEPNSGETGSVGAGPAAPASPDTSSAPVAAAQDKQAKIESPDLTPGQGDAARAEAEMPKAEMVKAEADAPKPDAPKIDAPKADAGRSPGKLMIMPAASHAGDREGSGPQVESGQAEGTSGKRRFSAMAAVVVLATVAGALGGALATASLGHFAGGDATASRNPALEASVARIDADLQTQKLSVDHTSKVGMSQFNKTSERLDKLERAQAEPAAKLAKLSEAVEKLRAASVAQVPVAAAPAAAKETTGSISPPAAAAVAAAAPAPVPLPAPKPELARLPTVEGWILRDVSNGVALIEGRRGMFEVYAGDPVPGLGRVDAIRKQDGRWVVVTSKGLVVAH